MKDVKILQLLYSLLITAANEVFDVLRSIANEVLIYDSAAMVSAQNDIETPRSSIFSLTKKRARSTKINSIPQQAYLIADKHGMSSRCLTEMAAAFHSLQGTHFNQLNLSVKGGESSSQFRWFTIAKIEQ